MNSWAAFCCQSAPAESEKSFFIQIEQMDEDWSNRFSFAPLTHHLTPLLPKKKKTHTVYFSLSLFPASSICLSCLFSFTVCPSLLLLRLFKPPALLLFFFSQWISLSKQTHSSQNRWVWNVPTLHTAMDDSSPQWDCVYFLISFVLSSAIYFSLFMPIHTKTLTVSTVSPCFSFFQFFSVFRDIQSSAPKLGYSMPLPNCPTASGSDCSS